MQTPTAKLTQDRAEYRRLRGTCARHTVRRFDEVARGIAHELADGEDITSSMYVQAAEIICAGMDHA